MSEPLSNRGFVVILSAPSGAGKTTLAQRMVAHFTEAGETPVQVSVSTTTRAARPGEEQGIAYHFVDMATFRAHVDEGRFLEWAEVFDNCYGTSRDAVEPVLEKGGTVLLDIDWQGARQVRSNMAGADVVSIFIIPPSHAELHKRLCGRGTDSAQVVQGRMDRAAGEMSHWDEYDYLVVNDDLERAAVDLIAIIQAERLRRQRSGRRLRPILETFDLMPEKA